MGPKQSKKTKKFQRKHLANEISRRKAAKTAAQRRRAKEMRLAASTLEDGDAGEGSGSEDEADAAAAAAAPGQKRLEDMSIDEFLNAGAREDGDGGEDSDEDDDERDGGEDGSKDDSEIDAEDGSDDEEWPEGDEDDDEDEEEDEEEEDEADADDDANAPLAGVKKSNVALKRDIAQHKKDLETLKEKDPEFYKFLQEEDEQLLDFDESDPESDSDDEDEDEEEDAEEDDASEDEDDEENETRSVGGTKNRKGNAKGDVARRRSLTSATVAKLCDRAMDGASLGAARNLLRAYRAAAHYGDEDADEELGVKLASSAAFHSLVTFTLEEADAIFYGLLGKTRADHPDEARQFKPHQQTRWRKVEPLVKSFLGNTLHLLGQLTDADMSRFLLSRLNVAVPFFATFERLTRKTLKATLALFGSGEPALRVQSILLIRNMAAVLPPPTLEKAAKGVYRQFAANAKFVNQESIEHVQFMTTCVSEIYGLDQNQSYALAFTYVRQLASLLRGALTNTTKEAFRSVYCWQYVNCLECWVKVLQSHAADENAALRPLVYPVAQVALGAARLLPSARYAPLRLRLIRALNGLSRSTGHFVPVAPLLLELLGFSELNKAPVSTKARPPDFGLVLRVAKQELRSPAVQELIVEGSLAALCDHLNQWAYSPGFPELAHVPSRDLKRFCKQTQVQRFRKMARSVVDAAERNSDWISRKRDNADFAPKDAERVRTFLSADRENKRAPMEKLAAQMKEKERQRAEANRVMDVRLGGAKPMGRGSDGTSDSDDDDDDGGGGDRGGEEEDFDDDGDGGDGDEDDDDEEEFKGMDDEDVLAALASRAGAAGGTGGGLHVRPKLPPRKESGDDDVVEDLIFSDDDDDDDDDDDARKKKKKKKSKKNSSEKEGGGGGGGGAKKKRRF
jgi:nucleolar complex protein 2